MKKKYSLTPEHRVQHKPWAEKWIKNVLSTNEMSADEKLDCVKFVKEMYKVANLNEPDHILFVKSPIALMIAGGFAAAIVELGDKAKITIPELVNRINNDATLLSPKSYSKWYVSPYKIRDLAEEFGLNEIGLKGVRNYNNMWNGGNQWSGWVSYLSFFRHVAKLDIDYSKWDCYEKLAEFSGPRMLHEKFCIISDRPEFLKINERNQSHNDKGPFCQWRDGTALYAINGVRVPAYVVKTPQDLTVEKIESESNLEVRRVMIDVYGREKFILDSNSQIVHSDDFGVLYRKELVNDEPLMMVKVVNSTPEPDGTFKDYFIRVDPNAYSGLKTARAAVASTWRKPDGNMIFETPDEYTCEIET